MARLAPAWNTASPRTGRSASSTTTPSSATTIIGLGQRQLGAYTPNVDIRQDIDLVTARINYRFGGPAVTRY